MNIISSTPKTIHSPSSIYPSFAYSIIFLLQLIHPTMEKPKTPPRSVSCRGVSFEIKPQTPQAMENITTNNQNGRWVWLPWAQNSSFQIVPLPDRQVTRTDSIVSSHFCDLDNDDDDDEEQEEENVDVEKQDEQAVYIQKPSKPKNNQSRLSVILLDQGLFTMYKRLFVVCFTFNILMLVLAITNHFSYAKKRPALFCMANILALTLCRSEAFLRIVFWLAVKLLGRNYVPLFIKTAMTSLLQSLGGIHSSCGLSSVAWLIYALVQTLNNRQNTSNEIIAVSSSILSLICLSCVAAFPLVRHLHHNVFERTHRFAGWSALLLLWAFIILTTGYDPKSKSYSNLNISTLLKHQEFFITIAITVFTIVPWLTVRRVPVSVTCPSTHASIIKFEGGVPAGILGRISRSPLSEWHAFGIISDNKDSHMMLAGAVGDFTRKLVTNPPTHLWVRSVHFASLPYLVNMYRRAVLVATGSGICVFLSFLLQKGNADVCLIWVTKGVEENFGREIKEMMSGFEEDKVIVHDTAVYGRPNVAEMTVNAARKWKAEVVVVTSNPQGSKDVVQACHKAGIAAFGPIWDS